LADIEKSTIALFERVSPSVVQVVGRVSNSGLLSEDTEGLQSGTGFIWDRAGDIVTNNHVVAGVNEAGIFVRRLVIPGAGHFWATDPFDGEVGSYGAIAAPPVLRFLEEAL
jgi:S1-C subfamily serine protease